jgi:hypothetical protein
MGRQKAGKYQNTHNYSNIGGVLFDKSRENMRPSKKNMFERRLRNRLKRKYAKENLGSIIGRPKKPPIMNSEKIDGSSIRMFISLIEGGSKIYTCHVLGCGKIF